MRLHDIIKPTWRRGDHPVAAATDWRTKIGPRNQVTLEPDQPIRLRDGTIIRADIYRPVGAGPHPVLLSFSAYNKELFTAGAPQGSNEIGIPHYLASHEYVHVVAVRRGTGASDGEIDMWWSNREQDDIDEVITWCGTQPWADGKVAMFGASYYAMAQLAAAARGNPHLRAVMPVDLSTDVYRHVIYPGGVFNSNFIALWLSVNFTDRALRRRVPPALRHALSYLLTSAPMRALIRRVAKPHRVARFVEAQTWNEDFLRHYVAAGFDHKGNGDAFWQDLSAQQLLPQIRVPMLLGTNWSCVTAPHAYGALDAFYKATSAERKLFIAPAHFWMLARPWVDFQDEAIGFFDHHLKGIDNGYAALPRIRYWMEGEEAWRTASDWPPPEAKLVRLELQSPAAPSANSGALVDTAAPGECSWLCIPRGAPQPKGLDRIGETQNRRFEHRFDRDTAVVGPVRLTLRLKSTAIDTCIAARVLDIGPDGDAMPVAHGYLQLSNRKVIEELTTPNEIVHDFSRQVPLEPGRAEIVRLSLTPIANHFRAGHTLVLDIASRKDQQFASPESRAGREQLHINFDTEAPPYSARNTIIAGGSDASRLEFYCL